MSKTQRNKGRRGEYEVRDLLKPVFPNVQRHLEFQTHEAEKGIDLTGTQPFDIQVKIGQQVPKKIYDFIEQVKSGDLNIPVVICKRDRKKYLAVMYVDDFIELINKYLYT